MKEKLEQLLKNAYSPYSNFSVAAIVVMKDGKEFVGVNVENVSYGATICAERVAITSAIAHGYRPYDFEELYIMTSSNSISTCCFICRQVISEFYEQNKNITVYDINGNYQTWQVKDLCPFPFDSENLK